MLEEVKKLKNKKQKLTGKRKKIETEITRIDTAVKKFEEGIQLLSESKPRSASAEIEVILRESGPLHVRAITAELHRRKFQIAAQSVSTTLQVAAKKRVKYCKVAPATFALLESRTKISVHDLRSNVDDVEEL